jgi:hypothetical protein
MRIGAILATVAILGACTTTPQPSAPEMQDISFARGCWIDRMPSGKTGTIRVLPARDDSGAMQLDLMIYGATPNAEQPDSTAYTISPDGRTIAADIDWTGSRRIASAHVGWSDIPSGWTAAFWRSTDGRLMIKLTGNGDDHLVFQQARFGDNEMVLSEFNGHRDGCD